MKVLQNGKEVKDARVFFDANGGAQYVTVKGVNYDPKAFEFESDDPTKKTKPATTKKKRTPVTTKRGLKSRLSGVMSTKDVKGK